MNKKLGCRRQNARKYVHWTHKVCMCRNVAERPSSVVNNAGRSVLSTTCDGHIGVSTTPVVWRTRFSGLPDGENYKRVTVTDVQTDTVLVASMCIACGGIKIIEKYIDAGVSVAD